MQKMKKLTIVFTLAIIAIIGLYYLQTNTFTASDTTSSKKINSEQKTTPALTKNSNIITQTNIPVDQTIQNCSGANCSNTKPQLQNEEKLTAGFDLNFTIENICGDSICSNSEKSKGNCCIDCACLTGKVCNFEKKTCQTTIPPFSKQKQNEIITKYTQNNQDYVNYTYNSSFDSTYNSQSVRVIVLACNLNQTEPCFAYLVVNNQGNVISAYSTN